MGERLKDGAGHGRRRARPDDVLAGLSGLEALLVRALRAPGDRPQEGSEGEQRAVAAFRAARDTGDARARRVRARRRDDWRPQARRHTARSLRVTLCALIAGLALGGAAFAAIGSGTGGDDGIGVGVRGGGGGVERPRQSAGGTTGPSGALSAVPAATGGADRDRPATSESGKEAAARCRAYEKARGRGEDLGSLVWQGLVAAAGGESHVEAYCAVPGRRTATAKDDGTGKDGGSHKAGGAGDAGKAGELGKAGGTGTTGRTAEVGGAARPDASAEPERSARPEGSSAKAKAQDTGAGNGG
ncbi:hypothetical protein [Streptomyces sp. LUP30]|uniref:hypothetical protein n=1 Tax=Streptomyces sp. LUP30 TaxID=1890285 RepID=UPI000851A956|nr:hypothetical protein [Streptomyces sp. LUP30]